MNIDKRQNLFIVGDVHGMYQELDKLLEHYNPEDDTLVFIGDLMDRGYDSRRVLERVYSLYSDVTKSVVLIRGNHEAMLLDFLSYPTQLYKDFKKGGGSETLISLLGEEFVNSNSENETVIAQAIKDKYPELVEMLNESLMYYQRNNVLCVHAGVNPKLKDYRMSTDQDFMWIREEFIDSDRVWKYTDPDDGLERNLKIIHGHTPNPQAPIMYYNRINIDGGCVFGGSLIGILLNQYGDLREVTKINSKFHLTKPTF